MFDGEVEADESYFSGQRKGKRSRGAAGKVAVSGLLKRNGKNITFAADIKKPLSLGCQRGMLRKVMRPSDGVQYIRFIRLLYQILKPLLYFLLSVNK